jgi:4-amino-4-deoxy-L-arabinose transferase-like glycosyltransferase
VEICFRAGRCVFPDRDDLQALTLLVGGLLPMNVYMSQTLGNEPLCGMLSALILLWGWQALREPAAAHPSRRQWRLGILFGLDLLTKMSALLLAPIIAVVLAAVNRRRGLAGTLAAGARCFGAAVLVSGWYYVRNYVRFGKLLVGGWDPVRGILWWQDPGYRTPSQIVSFGRSLWQPIHAGFYSIADGFFASLWLDCNFSGLNDWETRSPWNMPLLLAGPLAGARAIGRHRGGHAARNLVPRRRLAARVAACGRKPALVPGGIRPVVV